MSNYSDNTKPQIHIKEFLPEVYQSDTNASLSDMIFDRFLSKDDTTRVAGQIGLSSKSPIPEYSLDSSEQAHRQGFQLAPTMYTKIGTVDHSLSYHNFLAQLKLQGIDPDRMNKWASSVEYNWVPPVNINMLINYKDYMWNSSVVTDGPQYLTIENTCHKATDNVATYENLMRQRGMHFNLIKIDYDANAFIIDGNYTNLFPATSLFDTGVSNATILNDKSWTVLSTRYVNRKTVITVVESIAPSIKLLFPKEGDWWFNSDVGKLYEWTTTTWKLVTNTITAHVILPATFPTINVSIEHNSFEIFGKQDDIIKSGFKIITNNTIYPDLNNKKWTVESVEYNNTTYNTTVIIKENIGARSAIPISNPVDNKLWLDPAGNILKVYNGTSWEVLKLPISVNLSLSSMLSLYISEMHRYCVYQRGWDISPWDDNTSTNSAWNVELLAHIKADTESVWLFNNAADSSSVSAGHPLPSALWYDTAHDILKQYQDSVHGWKNIMTNFSAVVGLSDSTENWDETILGSAIGSFSGPGSSNISLNQWVIQNKWQHKSVVSSFSTTKRAQVPIIEYDSRVELNEWTNVQYTWMYRKDNDNKFGDTLHQPNRLELEPIKGYNAIQVGSDWYIYLFDKKSTMNANINLTDVFVPGYKFRIVGTGIASHVYTTESSEFRDMTNSAYRTKFRGSHMVTIVKIKETNFLSPLIGTTTNKARIIPIKTSLGDSWRGYHMHWMLDTDRIFNSPTNHQQRNFFVSRDLITTGVSDPVFNNPNYADFTPQIEYINYGSTYQEFIVNIPDRITDIDLLAALQFNPNNSIHTYATLNSNEIRLFINGVQQYGNFTEKTALKLPNYTVVYNDVNLLAKIKCVVGIVLDDSVNIVVGDIIRIEVGPASFVDMGLHAVPVRTILEDNEFDNQVKLGNQPEYRSLTSRVYKSQHKHDTNQYPLFNIIDLFTDRVIKASPIISFREKTSFEIDSNTQHRILDPANHQEFEFEQHLVDVDNGIMYGYHLHDRIIAPDDYWYSPLTNKIQQWDGYSWNENIIAVIDSEIVIRKIVISKTDPEYLWNISRAMWFNNDTYKLYYRTPSNWEEITGVRISDTNPMLHTIWESGVSNEQYIPKYVDKSRYPVSIGSSNGSWEVLNQWMFNPDHQNRQFIKFSHFLTHFDSIIKNQVESGINTIFNQPQSVYNYGLGGTIKEYNGAFDSLISAVNVSNVTPIGVIEFAADQYAAALRNIKETYDLSFVELCANLSSDSFTQPFSQYLIDVIISKCENNDSKSHIYNDTSAFDVVSGKGVRNWIATAPILGLTNSHKPHLIHDNDVIQIYHHDGHRSDVYYTPDEITLIINAIVSIDDTRHTGSKLGHKSLLVPAMHVDDIIGIYGGNDLRPGIFWNKTNTNALYRLNLIAVQDVAPDLTGLNDGVRYYNTALNRTYIVKNNRWSPIGNVGIVSSAWELIDIQSVLGEIYLEIESRLYSVCSIKKSALSNVRLINDESDSVVYTDHRKKRFEEYVSKFSVDLPYINTQYNITDPFTWNYYASTIVNHPHQNTLLYPSASVCWQMLYSSWFNTPYPHREPWKLQGYINKPDWWDDEYRYTDDSSRFWKHIMWTNVLIGRIPAHRPYPDGRISTGNASFDAQSILSYNYVCVNTSDSVLANLYNPDDLLPPYFFTSDPVNRSFFNTMNLINSPDADYIYGTGSIHEWKWSISARYPHEELIISYQMEPIRFLRAILGAEYITVNGLEIDKYTNRVYSHKNTLFHGDIIDTNAIYRAIGINQWYVNFNRYTGFDTNDEFRELWTKWSPVLTYQCNGIIDDNALKLSTDMIRLTPQDYTVLLINNGVFKDIWVDSFVARIVQFPGSSRQYNNEYKWKLELSSTTKTAREISYYGVKSYPFVVNIGADTCYANRFPIIDGDQTANRFFVSNDVTDIFHQNFSFSVFNSTANNRLYKVSSSIYEPTLDRTRITVIGPIASSIFDGLISISGFVLSFVVGDMVVLSSTSVLPAPLVPDTPYYIASVSDNTFKLAETFNDSISGTFINITSAGTGIHKISEVDKSFNVTVQGIETLWYHYKIDKSTIKKLSPPYSFSGMQQLINIIDGYSEYQLDQGVIYNTESSGLDYNTNKVISWHTEVERFISYAILMSNDVGSYSDYQNYLFEINPNRNSIIIDSKVGVLADVVQGPYTDIRVKQTIYDQYGRTMSANDILVNRQDRRNKITPVAQLPNDIYGNLNNDPYQYIHLGGGHLFLEGYEHFIMFNSYTTNGALIYDSFLGLTTPTITTSLYKKSSGELRPNLGGYFLSGNNFVRNIEGSISDLHNYYDVYTGSDDTVTNMQARSLVGYNTSLNFLDALNVDEKTQFLFYRGMIKAKGTDSSVLAYTNSRRLTNTSIDDFWAFKIADFGELSQPRYPEILIHNTDNIMDDIRFEFIGPIDDINSVDVQDAIQLDGFQLVEYTDETRWNNFPLQKQDLQQPLFLDGDISRVDRILVSHNQPTKKQLSEVDFWCDNSTSNLKLYKWDGLNWILDLNNRLIAIGDYVYWKHAIGCDDVRIIKRIPTSKLLTMNAVSSYSATNTSFACNSISVKGDVTQYLYAGAKFHVVMETAFTGDFTVNKSWYNNNTKFSYINTIEPIPANHVGGTITYEYVDLGTYESVYFEDDPLSAINYTIVNSHVVRVGAINFSGLMMVYNIVPANKVITPVKLVNISTDNVVDQSPLWHPAFGINNEFAMQGIDIISNKDPALYSSNKDVYFWNSTEVGKTWLDTSMIAYVPYYDKVIYPNISDRLLYWGNLAPFAHVSVNTWVKSTVSPSNWDKLVISNPTKYSGTPRKKLYKQTRVVYSGQIRFDSLATTINTLGGQLTPGDRVFIESSSKLPGIFQNQTKFEARSGTSTIELYDIVSGNKVIVSGNSSLVSVVDVGSSLTPLFMFQTKHGLFSNGDKVKFSHITNGSFPTCTTAITGSVEYIIENLYTDSTGSYDNFIINNGTISISPTAVDTGAGPITITCVQTNVTIIPSFNNNNWVQQHPVIERTFGVFVSNNKIPLTSNKSIWNLSDLVSVYINGVFAYAANINSDYTIDIISGLIINLFDYVDLVQPLHVITDQEKLFDPNIQDDKSVLIYWKEEYEYSAVSHSTTLSGALVTTYYFWVDGITTKSKLSANLTSADIKREFVTPSTSYMVVQKPLDVYNKRVGYGYGQPNYGTMWGLGNIPEVVNTRPVAYREVIVRNITTYINDNTSYMLRFTNDKTLRDSVQYSNTGSIYKERHDEWLLFRKNQSNNIPIVLWDKLVDALVGSNINGESVPSIDKVLYDDKYNTVTRFGLGVGQSFVNRSSLITLLNYLQSPNRLFVNIDIHDFLYRHQFDTTIDIRDAMMEIYETFGAEHVNNIWFEMLQDALATTARYPELIKTSWIAIESSIPLIKS